MSGLTSQLVLAVEAGLVEAARELLDAGADVNLHDKEDQLPLVEAADDYAETVLCRAVFHGHTQAVRLLIEYGVDVKASGETQTPLQYALDGNHAEIAELLRKAGASRLIVRRHILPRVESPCFGGAARRAS